MQHRNTHTAVAVMTTVALLVSIAVLTLATAGTPSAQAGGCRGGGSPSPSASESASPSGGGGGLPTQILTILPGQGGSPSSSESGSPEPSSSGSPEPSPSGSVSPSSSESTSDEQKKRAAVPVVVQQDQTCKSSVTIRYSNRKKVFTGRVKSEAESCRKDRRVKVKKVKKGKDGVVGRKLTNRRGVYKVRERTVDGKFYAVAAKSTVKNGDSTTTCRRARSKTIKP